MRAKFKAVSWNRVEKKRKIADSVWVHNVVTVRTGKVAMYPRALIGRLQVDKTKCS